MGLSVYVTVVSRVIECVEAKTLVIVEFPLIIVHRTFVFKKKLFPLWSPMNTMSKD